MDVLFGKKLEVPAFQNLKIKCEPINNQSDVLAVSEIYDIIIYIEYKIIKL